MRSRLAAFLLALCVAACATALAFIPVTPLLSTALSSRANDDVAAKQIVELEIKKDWSGLAAFALQNIKRDPEDTDWWLILGYAQIQQRQYSQAIEILDRAIARNPEDIDPRNLLGEALRLSGKPVPAAQVLERALYINSNTPATRFLLGEAYRDDNRLERAKEAYRDAIRIDPEFSPAWAGLAGVLARTGPRVEFDEAMTQLMRLEPELAKQILSAAKPAR
jgi:cytochrome c-type biogenesis protein CcmH/NrfG